MFHAAATLGFLLVAAGWMLRYRLGVHVLCMGTAGLTDYAILAALLLLKGPAIEQEAAHPGPLLLVHIAASTLTLLAYPVLATLGIGYVKGKASWLPWHRRLGKAFLVVKAVNYATSWGV